mmetsp:Transcript_72478/g.125706  ORF Transcript_72478/g.125706 Transcript_72478/m.125706 type:complete len:223 (+) Transcript_72478:110-778(+)
MWGLTLAQCILMSLLHSWDAGRPLALHHSGFAPKAANFASCDVFCVRKASFFCVKTVSAASSSTSIQSNLNCKAFTCSSGVSTSISKSPHLFKKKSTTAVIAFFSCSSSRKGISILAFTVSIKFCLTTANSSGVVDCSKSMSSSGRTVLITPNMTSIIFSAIHCSVFSATSGMSSFSLNSVANCFLSVLKTSRVARKNILRRTFFAVAEVNIIEQIFSQMSS